jgi:hypothetical protein
MPIDENLGMRYLKDGLVVVAILGLVCAVSSDAKDKVSDDGLTVSHDSSSDPPFQWTLERMLLASPMPMTAEGRNFLSTHPNLDKVRTWNDAECEKYLDSDYAKQHVAEEACRWRNIAQMLETQVTRGSSFLGKPVPPLSKSSTSTNWSNLTADDIRKMLDGKNRQDVFTQLKLWRQEIADLAPRVETIRKEAAAKGVSDRLENVMAPDQ